MVKPHPIELRARVIAFVEEGNSHRRGVLVDRSTVSRLLPVTGDQRHRGGARVSTL